MRRLGVVVTTLVLSWSSVAWAKKKPHSTKAETTTAPASNPTALEELEAAKHRLQALKADAKRKTQRAPWLKIASQLEAITKHYPKSAEASKALFDQAQLYEELAHVSWMQDDFDSAADLYSQLIEHYSESTLADDAHMALARIYLARHDDEDRERARAELKRVLRSYPHGDMATQAKQLLATLPAEEKPHASKKHAEAEEPTAKSTAETTTTAPAPAAANTASATVAANTPSTPIPTSTPTRTAVPIVASETADGQTSVDAEEEEGARESAAKEQRSEVMPISIVSPSSNAGVNADAHKRMYEELVRLHQLKPDRERLVALKGAVRTSGELPISTQMGLKIRRVAIDAGHGGHDTGAVGPTGIKEKDVTLAVSQKLADKLRAQGLEVVLTRTDDHFVALEKRTAIANEAHADLFISVHCNASTIAKLHGVETYSLNASGNQYAMRLAARENAYSERSLSDLQFLLADLTTKANTQDSRRLARTVNSSVVEGLRTQYEQIRDLGPKEALFYVLLGTRMPAILVEGSFISNPTEEERLNDDDFQEALAQSIAAGVERFVEDRSSLSKAPAVAGLP
jgi:N-acetylmuramoyl-L-alanine amidase